MSLAIKVSSFTTRLAKENVLVLFEYFLEYDSLAFEKELKKEFEIGFALCLSLSLSFPFAEKEKDITRK